MNKFFSFFSTFFILLTSCSSSYYKGPANDHFDGRRFFHPWSDSEKSLLTILKWRLTSEAEKWPDHIDIEQKIFLAHPQEAETLSVSFVNHSTVYLQYKGIRFITDPHWSERASPVSFAGPKRVHAPGTPIDKLPGLDFVIVSHNHYDHFDIPTLEKLYELYQPTFYIPLGDRHLLKNIPQQNIIEMDWYKPQIFNHNVHLNFVPVRHWSARGIFDRNQSLWGGYVIQIEQAQFFFSGDSGYAPIFKELKSQFGPMDFSMIPIGAYEPRWFMQDAHMNPQEAVQVHQDLESRASLGIHWGLWQLTDEKREQPPKDLAEALESASINKNKFITINPGETQVFEIINEKK